jgi:hypothetical protein
MDYNKLLLEIEELKLFKQNVKDKQRQNYLYKKDRYGEKLNEYSRKSYEKLYKNNDEFKNKKKEYKLNFIMRKMEEDPDYIKKRNFKEKIKARERNAKLKNKMNEEPMIIC